MFLFNSSNYSSRSMQSLAHRTSFLYEWLRLFQHSTVITLPTAELYKEWFAKYRMWDILHLQQPWHLRKSGNYFKKKIKNLLHQHYLVIKMPQVSYFTIKKGLKKGSTFQRYVVLQTANIKHFIQFNMGLIISWASKLRLPNHVIKSGWTWSWKLQI